KQRIAVNRTIPAPVIENIEDLLRSEVLGSGLFERARNGISHLKHWIGCPTVDETSQIMESILTHFADHVSYRVSHSLALKGLTFAGFGESVGPVAVAPCRYRPFFHQR